MEFLIYFFAGTVVLFALLAAIAIWAPRKTAIRAVALAATALLMPLGYVELTELLSRPKPIDFEWFEREALSAVVLGVSFEEGKAIYLWLQIESTPEPRYYILPWRQELAERLEQAVDDATSRGSTVTIASPFSPKSLEALGNMNIEIIPPPVPPTKMPPFEKKPQVPDPRQRNI
jgi:hypothetical protein